MRLPVSEIVVPGDASDEVRAQFEEVERLTIETRAAFAAMDEAHSIKAARRYTTEETTTLEAEWDALADELKAKRNALPRR